LNQADESGAWNPGIQSPIPADLRHLCTTFRAENVLTSLDAADELHDLTGIPATELVAFRARRLALHELLVRISADYAVPDGSRIEDLGINFRQMAGRVLEAWIEPAMAGLEAEYARLRQRAGDIIQAALRSVGQTAPVASDARRSRSGLFARFAARRAPITVPTGAPIGDVAWITEFEQRARNGEDELERAVYRALARVSSALFNRHGGGWEARSGLIGPLAADLACNEIGGDTIGRTVDALLERAAVNEGFYRLPPQQRPIVMNTKGPSAAGKSSLRPLQKRLAGDIGVSWADFALISPDIWRKQLLDYQSLGVHYKYAGAMTGDELQIIDAKLDRYMARKYQRGDMSHLLIDRFRFDSFAPNSNEAGSNLLTRFGQTVYLFFVITSPESLVERAWDRGLQFGRYKAVGDTLAHSVEAYAGMPDLFFTWIRRSDKSVHFEFLDNSVRLGERPRTVAYGNNQTLNLLDVRRLIDIERFRRVNVAANSPEQLYADRTRLASEHNTGFLQRCIERFAEVNFADQATGRVYLRIAAGSPVAVDREALERAVVDADTRAGIKAVAPSALDGTTPLAHRTGYLYESAGGPRAPTLGQWGFESATGESACA
jgi:hypothetical protein